MPVNLPSGAAVYVANKRADSNFKFKKPLVVSSKATSPSSDGMSIGLNTSDLSVLN